MKRSAEAEAEEEEEEIENTQLESVHDTTLRTAAKVRENIIQLGTKPWPEEMKFRMYIMSYAATFARDGVTGGNGAYNVSLEPERDYAAVFSMLKDTLASSLTAIDIDIDHNFHFSYHRVHAREANVGDLHYHIDEKYANKAERRRMAEALR